MKQLTCEMCGGTDLIKQDGVFVCQNCGMKYSVEDAKRMMIEGTVDVQGTVKIDNSAFVEKYLANARRAYEKEDWEEVEKYYNMVEQNTPHNIEAVFFSSFGKTMASLSDSDFIKRAEKFKILNKSISVIDEYFEKSTENKEDVIHRINSAILKMQGAFFINGTSGGVPISKDLTIKMMKSIRSNFLFELNQIKQAHPEITYLDELILENSERQEQTTGGCYVATAVYGSYDCPQVWTLRRYRDYSLAKTWYGRAFIHTYYAISPTLVKWFGHTKWFKKLWRCKLDHIVEKLKAKGVEDAPYEDKNW